MGAYPTALAGAPDDERITIWKSPQLAWDSKGLMGQYSPRAAKGRLVSEFCVSSCYHTHFLPVGRPVVVMVYLRASEEEKPRLITWQEWLTSRCRDSKPLSPTQMNLHQP